jgi:hypothetical protein
VPSAELEGGAMNKGGGVEEVDSRFRGRRKVPAKQADATKIFRSVRRRSGTGVHGASQESRAPTAHAKAIYTWSATHGAPTYSEKIGSAMVRR